MVTPAARREAVAHLCGVHGVSQRRACRAIGVERTSVRYRHHRGDDAAVRSRLRELAAVRRRFGWRRLHVLLAREGIHVNHKKLRRLYIEERLQVRRRGGRKRALGTRAPMVLPLGPNQRWSLDFVSDTLTDGRRFRILAVVDDYSRFAYSEILPDERGTSCAAFFARALEQFHQAGIRLIDAVMTDNHWSYTHSGSLAHLLAESSIKHILIKPHCPWQNGKVERLNRTLQTERAYRQVFTTNDERTGALAPWLEHYNTQRRHSALAGNPPISRLSPT